MIRTKIASLTLCNNSRSYNIQVRQVGKEFYNTDIKCEVLQTDESHGFTYVVMKLAFDNSEKFIRKDHHEEQSRLDLPISPNDFFSLFPFHMVLNKWGTSLFNQVNLVSLIMNISLY